MRKLTTVTSQTTSPAFQFRQNAASKSLERTYKDMETRRSSIIRNIQVERNNLKGSYSTPTVRILEDAAAYGPEHVPFAMRIPGFRYKSNGDPKKTAETLRRDRLHNSISGLIEARKPRHTRSSPTNYPLQTFRGAPSETSLQDSTVLPADYDDDNGSVTDEVTIGNTDIPLSPYVQLVRRGRHSIGNTSGYKIGPNGKWTRHNSCFNISPQYSEESVNFLHSFPSSRVRQVQRQLGLHARPERPVVLSELEYSLKDMDVLERVASILEANTSVRSPEPPDSECVVDQKKSLTTESLGKYDSQDTAQFTLQPQRRREPRSVARPDSSTGTAPAPSRPRWKIAPIGHLVPSPLKSISSPLFKARKSSASSFMKAKSKQQVGLTRNISLPVAGRPIPLHPSTSSTTVNRPGYSLATKASGQSTGLKERRSTAQFETVVSMMEEANTLRETTPSLFRREDFQEQRGPRHFIFGKPNVEELQLRSTLDMEALRPRIDKFLDSLECSGFHKLKAEQLQTTDVASIPVVVAIASQMRLKHMQNLKVRRHLRRLSGVAAKSQ